MLDKEEIDALENQYKINQKVKEAYNEYYRSDKMMYGVFNFPYAGHSSFVLNYENYYSFLDNTSIVAIIDKRTNICYNFARYIFNNVNFGCDKRVKLFADEYKAKEILTYL